MLRRNIRLRKEYLYRKSIEQQANETRERKKRVKAAMEAGKPLSAEDRKFEASVRSQLALDDERSLLARSTQDDEYAYAVIAMIGVKDPHILLTTCRDPSSRLLQFVKELKLVIPNSQRVNRGAYVVTDLVKLCQTNDVTDLIVVHEHRGVPDGLIVSHMPLGPTVYFALEDVVLRHDLPDKPPAMSQVNPHLIFEQMNSRLGTRIATVLRFLFPPASPSAQRVLAFTNCGDKVHFRHYVWNDERPAGVRKHHASEALSVRNNEASDAPNVIAPDTLPAAGNEAVVAKRNNKSLEGINLSEVGPRFVLKPYRIELGTLDMKELEVEWALKAFFKTPRNALSI